MPIYEYECGSCQSRFEKKQRFEEEPVAVCPECEGEARRLIHPVPVIFKGSGFYITDNRKNGNTEPEESKEALPAREKPKEKEAV